jgi:hypothetical protein
MMASDFTQVNKELSLRHFFMEFFRILLTS